MAVAPTAAYGTLLKQGVNTIAKVSDITPPELLREVDEITNHSGAGWKEFLPTLKELAEFTITILYDSADTQHAALVTALTAGTLASYNITFTDTGAEVWTFSAYVTRFKLTTPLDGANRAEVTLRPSGANVIS
jgi:hypothetical protein